jgi:hypothetical protein
MDVEAEAALWSALVAGEHLGAAIDRLIAEDIVPHKRPAECTLLKWQAQGCIEYVVALDQGQAVRCVVVPGRSPLPRRRGTAPEAHHAWRNKLLTRS